MYVYNNSNEEVWKKIRSSASKQVVPRRVGNFVEPLCDIADELLEHLESTRKESGNDIRPEVNKWAFQGIIFRYLCVEKAQHFST